MYWINLFRNIFRRLRYPVSLPEDVAEALGISFSNHHSFGDFIQELCSHKTIPNSIYKFMPRNKAEKVFSKAIRVERFSEKTLIFYYFNEGWLEFVLAFDKDGCLRRLYLVHKEIKSERGFEILLKLSESSILNKAPDTAE